jgi:hypothetical protein
MAKHDQRILKFLNQNADRAPTITEMMTRLSISISDISDSLASLQGQGLVSMRTNAQGIECWFPASSSHAQPAPVAAPTIPATALAAADRPGAAPAPAHAAATVQMAAMGHAAAPDPQPPIPRKAVSALSPLSQGREALPAANPLPAGATAVAVAPAPPPRAPEPETATLNAASPAAGVGSLYNLAPAPRGIGILTLLAGLIAAVALSAYVTTRLIGKQFAKASTAFVDRKTLAEANAALADFQEKTKAHVTALEDQVKKLSATLDSAKAATDSLKTVTAALEANAAKAAPVAKAKRGAARARRGR